MSQKPVNNDNTDTGYCNIKTFINKKHVKAAEMDIFGVIGLEVWDTSVARMLNQFKDVKEIKVRVDSIGGNITDGITIHNLLESHKAHVNIEIVGKAISMGSGIAMAGDHVTMHSAGVFMLHNPLVGRVGEAKDLRKAADTLDGLKESLINLYANKSGLSRNEISNLMDEETWLTSEQALEMGFIDEIITKESSKAVAMLVPTGLEFKNIPEFAQDLIKTENKMNTEIKDTPAPVASGAEEKKTPVTENDTEIFQNLVIEQFKAMNVKLDSVIVENTEIKAENKEIKEAKNLVDAELVAAQKETSEAKAVADKAQKVTNQLGVNLAGVSDDGEPEEKELTPMETWKNMPRDTEEQRLNRAEFYHKEIKMKKGNK